MKRLTFGQEAPELAADSARIAEEVMLLLARSAGGGGYGCREPRVFECKTCKRRFPSFQALGGHRASHKRPRGGTDALAQAPAAPVAKAPRTHECAVCGVEFALGQALGGHMRRHRAAGADVEEDDAGRGASGSPVRRGAC